MSNPYNIFKVEAVNKLNTQEKKYTEVIDSLIEKYKNNISLQDKFSIKKIMIELKAKPESINYIDNQYKKIGEIFNQMLFNLWRWIQLWLPYGLILWIYRRNQAIPTNIKTYEGNNYKAMLITEDYGILYSEDKYIRNRGQYLMEQKRQIEEQNKAVLNELNSLNMLAREDIVAKARQVMEDGGIQTEN